MTTTPNLDPTFNPRPEPWVGKRQVGVHLGRSTRWIEIAQRDRGLPFTKEGKHGTCWYRISAVEAWMASRGGDSDCRLAA